MNRLDFYEIYFKNVSPTTFNVFKEDGRIIIEDIDKPYPKGFNAKDVKQYPLLKETYMKTNDKGKLISKRIAKGEYEITYKGKKFDLIDVKGEVEGTLHWHIGEKEEGESWFSKRREDALWFTKAEAMDMIEYIVDRDEKGEYDYLNDPEYFKKGGKTKTWRNKYNKKYGYDDNESHSLKEISKDTGVSKKGLQQIYNKGVGAFKTNPSSVRPNVTSKEQWAMGRVYSAVMGGKASKVDAKELKMQYGGMTPSFVNFENGGVIGEEITLNTYNFSGYDYRDYINAEAGVSFLLTGEYELVSKYLYENDYAMWLFYNYLNRINISEKDMKAWVKEAYESFGEKMMPVPVAIRSTPDAKDGRSYAMWYATSNPRDLTLIDVSDDTKPYFYDGKYWINEIGMVANKKNKGWGAKFEERKTGLLIPYFEGESFHFNTIIHEFCHCLDFQTQLVENIKKKELRDTQDFKDDIIKGYGYRIDDDGIVVYDESLTEEERNKIALEIKLYGNLENSDRGSVSAPITNHLKEFCETLVRMLRHLADGNVPLTQVFEQEAIDVQIILEGVYGDELLEQRKRQDKIAKKQRKADEVRDNKRYSWQDVLNTDIKKFIFENSEDKRIESILKKKSNANLRLHQILEIDNLINKFIAIEFKKYEIYNPSKAKKMIPVIQNHKVEANRIINNHYDNIRNDYQYGFKPSEDQMDMVLTKSCPFENFKFYKDWKNCNKLRIDEYYKQKKEA